MHFRTRCLPGAALALICISPIISFSVAAQAVQPTAVPVDGPEAPVPRLPDDTTATLIQDAVPSPASGAMPVSAGLTLELALAEAESRSPDLEAATAAVEAARGRLRQAGFRTNPELSIEVENFAGTGPYSGFEGTETTVSVNQRLDLSGRRTARIGVGRVELEAAMLRLAIARADLKLAVRQQFATAVAARDRLRLARETLARAQELARIAGELVEAGREPPLRALRASSAAAQADAEVRAAEAEEMAARQTLGALLGADTPPAEVIGSGDLEPGPTVTAEQTLDVRLADVERLVSEAALQRERTLGRLDPAVGIGVRRIEETGDQALMATFSVPLPVFDRNQGNITAAGAEVRGAAARRAGVLARARAQIGSAAASFAAAQARVTALEANAMPQAQEALRLAQLSYQAGRVSLLELLDAQDAFATAQADLINARRAQAEAAAVLDRAAAQQEM